MKRRHVATGAVALTTAVAMAGAGATMAHAAGRSNDNIRLTNSGRTALPNHALMQTLGNAPSTTNLSLSIAVPLRNQALLDSLLAKGTVISPAEYTRLFGASNASLQKVSDWAKKQGLRVTSSNSANGLVNVSGSVRTVNQAFSLNVQRVALGTRTGLAPSVAPQVPASLGVVSVTGLSTITDRHTGPLSTIKSGSLIAPSRQSYQRTTGPQQTLGGAPRTAATTTSTACSKYWGQYRAVTATKFASESNSMCAYSPQQGVKLYNAGAAKTAKAKIGILLWNDDPNAKTYANLIADNYKYPRLVNYIDRSAKPGDNSQCGGFEEQNLDIQTSHAMAPSASIYYYGASSCYDQPLLAMFAKAVNAHEVTTLSMSWGGSESASSSFNLQFERIARQASLTGISLFASSADMGDGSIQPGDLKPSGPKDPSYPATSPNFTSVGGTAVALNATGGRAFTTGWQNTLWDQPKATTTTGIKQMPFVQNSVGAGGGISGEFAQPTWQKGVVTGSTSKRAFPDVGALADPATGLAFTFDGQYIYNGGGTSQAAPLVAALVSASKAITGRPIGNAAPYFYKLRGTTNLTDVKAVTSGRYGAVLGRDSNGHYVLEGIAQPADSLRVTTGWDDVTGLGEPSGSFLTAFGK